MNRRAFSLAALAAGLPLAAFARARVGTCSPCRRTSDCQTGLICQSGVCGPASASCGGRLLRCGAQRHLRCRADGSAVCVAANRRRSAAQPYCV